MKNAQMKKGRTEMWKGGILGVEVSSRSKCALLLRLAIERTRSMTRGTVAVPHEAVRE